MSVILGQPNLIMERKVGQFTRNKRFVFSRDVILLSEHSPLFIRSGALVIAPENVDIKKTIACMKIPEEDFDSLNEGDVVSVDPNGQIRVLWQKASEDNVLYITDFCNSKCVMCPQIPEGKPFSYYELCEKTLSLVKFDRSKKKIGITGGEPTLFKDEIVRVLARCKQKMPNADIAMLTNGKNFDDFDFAKKCALANRNVTYCIPLYVPFSDLHDKIVGCDGSFQRTMESLYNLIRLKCMIEIRIVVVEQNYRYLPWLMEYIFQNLPFVVHVAIMGMETTGLAKAHLKDVWIDPIDYQEQLKTSVLKLRRSGLNFSIYNLPRCLLPHEVWGYDRDSISAWEKTYITCCSQCLERENCCGLFSTSIMQSPNIQAIVL